MAVVLVSSMRIKIMVALGVRPMSPRMLAQELDGDYLASTIDQNLRHLWRHGWVEPIDTTTGAGHRSAVDQLYRAIRLPIFDEIVWPALPLAMREMISWRIVDSLVPRLSAAWDAGTFDAREDRHFTCTTGIVDEQGWERIGARINRLFEFLLRELRSAHPRLAASGEEPIQVLSASALFESPSTRRGMSDRSDGLIVPKIAVPKHDLCYRVAKVIADPLQLGILDALDSQPLSATLFFREFGKSASDAVGREVTENSVYRAFRRLKEFDWLVLADSKTGGRRRAAVENFYRPARPVRARETWPTLPESMRGTPAGNVLEAWIAHTKEAVEAHTMDARENRYYTWTPGIVDQRGWRRLVAETDAALEFTKAEVEAASVRLDESGEPPIPVTICLAMLESSTPSVRIEPGPSFA